MPLDQKQKEQMLAYIKRTAVGSNVCPLCGKGRWSLADGVWEFREFSGGGLRVGGPVIPFVLLVCDVCGNTLQISAVKAGLINPQDNEKEKEKEKELQPEAVSHE